MRFSLSLHVVLLLLCSYSFVGAASPPSETIFPTSTKGWVSVPDIDLLREHFDKTQLGELVKDPEMTKFMEDIHAQLRDQLNDTGVKLGVALEDLDGVYGGELGIGLIQPNPKDNNSHALAMVVDVTGKHPAAKLLLEKIEKNLTAKGAVKKIAKAGDDVLTQFTLPLKKGAKIAEHAVYVLHGDTLIVSDEIEVVIAMLGRLGAAPAGDSLKQLPAYDFVQMHVVKESGGLVPHVRWFIDPLGFAETNRAANGGRKKKGVDPLVVLRKNGFGELQGLGGYLHFATAQHETLYRTYIYSPSINAPAVAGKKLAPAAGILDLPNAKNLTIQPWVPHSVSTYLTWNWKMAKAFEHFGPLFDGFTEPGTFDEIFDGLKQDPAGPEIDIRKEIIALLGERVTVLTDYQLPINAQCERLLVAFELKEGNDKAALAAIRKLMKAEPNARKLEVDGHEVWEVAERTEDVDLLPPMIDGETAGFIALEPKAALMVVHAPAPPAAAPGIVVAVSQGNIFVGTHADFLGEVLKERPVAAGLAGSKDHVAVEKELIAIGSAVDCMRFFTRTDEAYRPTYELIQQGKLPTAETLLARAVNRILTTDKKGAVRKAVIDGKNMPPFGNISHYFGPGGFYMQTRPDGWFLGGCLLKNSGAALANKPK